MKLNEFAHSGTFRVRFKAAMSQASSPDGPVPLGFPLMTFNLSVGVPTQPSGNAMGCAVPLLIITKVSPSMGVKKPTVPDTTAPACSSTLKVASIKSARSTPIAAARSLAMSGSALTCTE